MKKKSIKDDFRSLVSRHKKIGGIMVAFDEEGNAQIGVCGEGLFCDVMNELAEGIIKKLQSGELSPVVVMKKHGLLDA